MMKMKSGSHFIQDCVCVLVCDIVSVHTVCVCVLVWEVASKLQHTV